MFDKLKANLYFQRFNLLYEKGISEGKIVPFDDEFYERLNHTYISDLPVSIHIKYLKPNESPGKCYDRSLYMFLSIDEAILVRGDQKDLEIRFGKEHAGHGWIEIGNYVYDPSLLLRFDKDLYYDLYKSTNIIKCSKEEYCSKKECKQLYDDIRNTSIEDFKPHGKKRIELSMTIPLVLGIAKNTNNNQFIDELNNFLTLIDYDEKEINDELNIAMEETMKNFAKKVR